MLLLPFTAQKKSKAQPRLQRLPGWVVSSHMLLLLLHTTWPIFSSSLLHMNCLGEVRALTQTLGTQEGSPYCTPRQPVQRLTFIIPAFEKSLINSAKIFLPCADSVSIMTCFLSLPSFSSLAFQEQKVHWSPFCPVVQHTLLPWPFVPANTLVCRACFCPEWLNAFTK